MPSNKEIFSRYPNPVFIETGSCFGDGVQQALDAGFQRVISIELHEHPYGLCIKRFEGNPKVQILKGYSHEVLRIILPHIKEPCTFWLDGHDEDQYPVLAELDAIRGHFIKTHTILIDDLRMFDEKKHGLSLEIIKYKILDINTNYKFSFEDGFIKNDILVAYEDRNLLPGK